MKHQSHPYRVYVPDGSVIGIYTTLRHVITEYPDAIRIERTDVPQPPRIIEDDSGE